jgi:carboxyl-terminal processing protease
MKSFKKNCLIWLLIAALLGFGFGRLFERRIVRVNFSAQIPHVEIVGREKEKPETVDFSLFWNVWERLEKNFLDKKALNPQKMIYGAISGMVSALGDPYTVFLPPQKHEEAQEELGGIFEGIGIQIGFIDKRLAVIAPLKDTPAYRAGLKAGDLILAIGDQETAGMSLPEAQELIRGSQGSVVNLTILRKENEDPKEFSIIRGKILIKSVEWETREGEIVYLKLLRFTEQTNKEWDKAVSEIRTQGPKIKGVVLDVRNNPGGYLSGSVYVASEFLKGGVVTRQELADGTKKDFRVEREGSLLSVPLVVLINKGSASASEIIAGALSEHHRARLVGEKSFGKGTIQEVQELPGGAGLHITTARWLLPSGRSVEEEGLTPDVELETTEEDIKAGEDPVLEKAIEISRETEV